MPVSARSNPRKSKILAADAQKASSKIDRLELIRFFVRIAETRSVSAAGRVLGLSQASSSRQLKQLEAIMGVQLVKRSTHDLVVTDAGEQFLTVASELLNLWDAALETARLGRDEYRGSIRVAVPVAIGQTFLVDIAARFLLKHPGVTLDWRLIDDPGDLAAGGYDLWIRAGPIRDRALIVHELGRTERAIVGNPSQACVGHPSELNSRGAVQLITFMTRQVPLETENGRTATLRLRPTFVTDNIYAGLAAIKRGVGYGILPYWLVNAELDAGTLIELCPAWKPPPISLSVAYPQARFRPARLKKFIEYLRNEPLRLGSNPIAPTSQMGRAEGDSNVHLGKPARTDKS
jgi:DNA-binding transcriptional LysR family regulator